MKSGSSSGDFDKTAIDDAIYHEIGHAVDYCLGFVSKTPQWFEIYNKCISYVRTNYSTTFRKDGVDEFFADCFEAYISRKEVFDNFEELHHLKLIFDRIFEIFPCIDFSGNLNKVNKNSIVNNFKIDFNTFNSEW